jgi:uncharacterized membrane protein YqgA involved in biofilm formation
VEVAAGSVIGEAASIEKQIACIENALNPERK